MGKDGNECPASCPMKCGPEEMVCGGAKDPNDCPMADFCTGKCHMMTLSYLKYWFTLSQFDCSWANLWRYAHSSVPGPNSYLQKQLARPEMWKEKMQMQQEIREEEL